MKTDGYLRGYLEGYMRKQAEGPIKLYDKKTAEAPLPFGLGELRATNYEPRDLSLGENLRALKAQILGGNKPNMEVKQGEELRYVPGVTSYLGAGLAEAVPGAAAGALLGGKGRRRKGAATGALVGGVASPALLYLLHRMDALKIGSDELGTGHSTFTIS